MDTKTALETLAAQYQGKFALGLSDVAQDQALAQQLRVQGIPSIRVIVDGQLADQMEGPQGEAALRALIDKLTMSSGDRAARASSKAYTDSRRLGRGALGVLQQAINEEPNNPSFKVEWADILALKGDVDGARTVVATIAEDVEGRDRPVTRIELAEEAAGMGTLAEAEADLAANPDDLDTQYRVAVLMASAGRFEEALAAAMSILQVDRSFRDDIGRTTMIRIMNLLGKDSEVAKSYRRRMFNFMH